MALLSMSIIPNVIRVIAEGEWAPRAFASIPRTPAICLALGVPDDACVMGCISVVVRREPQSVVPSAYLPSIAARSASATATG